MSWTDALGQAWWLFAVTIFAAGMLTVGACVFSERFRDWLLEKLA